MAPSVNTAQKYKERGNEVWALYLLEMVAAREGSPDISAAAAHYHAAMAAAQSLGMRPLTAKCHAALGELHRHAGDGASAREHVHLAAMLFREMQMCWSSGEASAMLVRRSPA